MIQQEFIIITHIEYVREFLLLFHIPDARDSWICPARNVYKADKGMIVVQWDALLGTYSIDILYNYV